MNNIQRFVANLLDLIRMLGANAKLGQPELKETAELKRSMSRNELFDLYKYYGTVVKDELTLFFQYLNFHVGLLSAILLATLAGFISAKSEDRLRSALLLTALLLGPLLIVALSRIGYLNVLVFYRRFLQASITRLNIATMLEISSTNTGDPGASPRPYLPSNEGNFIIEWPVLVDKYTTMLSKPPSKENNGISLAEIMLKDGRTLRHARWTFVLFTVVAIGLALVLIADILVVVLRILR